ILPDRSNLRAGSAGDRWRDQERGTIAYRAELLGLQRRHPYRPAAHAFDRGTLSLWERRYSGPALDRARNPGQFSRWTHSRSRESARLSRQLRLRQHLGLERQCFYALFVRQKISFIPVLLDWINDGGRIGGVVIEQGSWFNLNSPNEYLALHRTIATRRWRADYLWPNDWPIRIGPEA